MKPTPPTRSMHNDATFCAVCGRGKGVHRSIQIVFRCIVARVTGKGRASVARSLAIAASCTNGCPPSLRRHALYTSTRAASISAAARAYWNCIPWKSAIACVEDAASEPRAHCPRAARPRAPGDWGHLSKLLALVQVWHRRVKRSPRKANHLGANSDAAFVQQADRHLITVPNLKRAVPRSGMNRRARTAQRCLGHTTSAGASEASEASRRARVATWPSTASAATRQFSRRTCHQR
mgnify:CR=1 FL=1